MKLSSLLLLERYIKVASGSLYVLFLAKYLGAELYGEYSRNLAFIGLFSLLGFSGVDGIFQKKLSTSTDQNEDIKSFVFLKSIFIFIGLATYCTFGSMEYTLFIYFMPFLVSSALSFSYQGLVYDEKIKNILITSLVIIVISNCFRAYLFTHKVELCWYVLSYSIEAACYPLGYFIQYIFKKKIFKSKLNTKNLIVLIKDAWPLIFSTIIIGLFTKLALINLGKHAEVFEVGRFSLLLRIIEGMLIIAVSTSMLQLKKLLNAGCDYMNIKNTYLKNMYIIAFLVSVICYLSIIFIIPIIFGSEYIYSTKVAIITSCLVFFNFMGIYNGRLLVVEGYYYFPLIRNLVAFIVFYLFNLLFILNLETSLLSLLTVWVISSFVCMLTTTNTRRMLFFEHKK